MGKQVLGDFPLPEEGDIIDSIIREEEKRAKFKAPVRSSEVEELKRRVDLVALFASFGVTLRPTGKRHEGICPWHNDRKTPSLSVDRVKGLYHCFGCQEKGDAITLVEKMKGYGFREALDYLKKESGLSAFTHSPEPRREKAKTFFKDITVETEATSKQPKAAEPGESPPAPAAEKQSTAEAVAGASEAERRELLSLALEEYHKVLLSSTEALAYLESRKLKDFALLSSLKAGYCDGKSLVAKCSARQLEILKDCGLLSKYAKEHFAGCVIFPIFTSEGSIGEIYGRRITNKEPKHLYLPGPHEGVFNLRALKGKEEVILTESLLDALSLMVLGMENVSACFGAGGFTADILAALKVNNVREVVLGFDNDEAGEKASVLLKERLAKEGFRVKTIASPSGKDWNEALCAGFTLETLKELLKTAESTAAEPTADGYTCTKDKGEYHFFFPDALHYLVTNFKEEQLGQLKVVLKCYYANKFHCDAIDLYSFRQRESYSKQLEYSVGLPHEKGMLHLLKLLEYLEKVREEKLLGVKQTEDRRELSEEEKSLGLKFLANPLLFKELQADLATVGCVGEETNKVVLYLALTSRIRKNPISTYILGRSSGGKSWLAKSVLQLIPEDEKLLITTASNEVFYYMQDGLAHKAIMLGEFEGAENIEYILRELISDGYVSKLVTLKDQESGQLKACHILSKGPISLVSTSTDPDLNPENLSRCLLLHIDESEEQTKKILDYQRYIKSKAGYLSTIKAEAVVKKHHAVQKLLKDYLIFNTFLDELDFPTMFLLSRRAHFNFLLVLEMVAFILQEQHEKKQLTLPTGEEVAYIETDLRDYELTYALLMQGIMENSLDDVPKNAKDLYRQILKLVAQKAQKEGVSKEGVMVERMEIMQYSGWSVKQIKTYMKMLLDYGYLDLVSGGSHGQRHKYRVVKVESRMRELLAKIPTPEELKQKRELAP